MKKKILALAFTTFMLSGCVKPRQIDPPKHATYNVADYYDGYYSSIVSWTNGEDLKNQLNKLIRTGYTALSYEQNWNSNIDADHVQDNYFYVDGVYTSADLLSSSTQKTWQREHAFCASLMCGSLSSNAIKYKGRATDFHNLFASEAGANQSRGSKNYGVADTTNENYQNRTTNNGEDGYSFDNKIFEPGNKDKGRLARAIFYMGTMYKDAEHDDKNDIDMKGITIQEEVVDWSKGEWSGGEFAIGNLSTLLDWNTSYAVDAQEMQHNVSVQTYQIDGVAQGNRNPYVDYPGLVDYVYGEFKNNAGKMNELKPAALGIDANSDEHRHYTIKSAETSFGVGDTFDKSSIEIIDVNKKFKQSPYTGEFITSLDGYTFTADDVANGVTNYVRVGQSEIAYHIDVENSASMSYTAVVSKSGIDNTKIGTANRVTWGDVNWDVTFTGDSGFTLTNISAGGFKAGSGTSGKGITGFTATTADSGTFDAAYIKCKAGNKSSSFSLTIKVGDETLTTATVTCTDEFAEYGLRFTQPMTGNLSFIFTGSNALWVESVSYNAVTNS